MSETQEKSEPHLQKSGMPPSPSDSEGESDQGDPSTTQLPSVSQQEHITREANECPNTTGESTDRVREDPIEIRGEDQASGDDMSDHNQRHGDGVSTTHTHPASTSPTSLHVASPRGTDTGSTEDAVEATYSDLRVHESIKDTHVGPSQIEQKASLPTGAVFAGEQEVTMAPNLVPRGDGMKIDILEVVPEDEKKSEDEKEKDSELMPPPEPVAPPFDRAPGGLVSNGPAEAAHESMPLVRPHALPGVASRPVEQFHMPQHLPMSYGYAMAPVPPGYLAHAPPVAGGRRKILLRLEEDAARHARSHSRRPSFFFGRSNRSLNDTMQTMDPPEQGVDRGSIAVSWFEGTSSVELQEHVRKSVIRKMGLQGNVKLADLRIIDETMDPPEGNSRRGLSSTSVFT